MVHNVNTKLRLEAFQWKNVTFMPINTIACKMYTRHGLHLNMSGKRKLSIYCKKSCLDKCLMITANKDMKKKNKFTLPLSLKKLQIIKKLPKLSRKHYPTLERAKKIKFYFLKTVSIASICLRFGQYLLEITERLHLDRRVGMPQADSS